MCMSQLFEALPMLVMGGLWVIGCDSAIEGSSVVEGVEDVNTEIWERALAGAVGMEAVDEGREESEEGQGEWPRQELSPKPQGLRVSPLGVWEEGRPAHLEASREGGRRGPRLRRQARGAAFTRGDWETTDLESSGQKNASFGLGLGQI